MTVAGANLPAGTRVTAENWKDLQQRGLVFITNEYPGTELERTLKILEWEIGEDRIFTGDPHVQERIGPLDDSVGIYVLPPDENWVPFWYRYVDYDDDELSPHQHLLFGDKIETSRWHVREVHGSERFRCWGPTTTPDTRHEGTLAEIITHITTWEAQNEAAHN